MNAKIWIRIAAGCMLFFALGHLAGHFSRNNTDDPHGKEVINAMKEYKRDLFGTMRSYDENYTGMSLNLVATLLMLTVVLWVLSNLVDNNPKATTHIIIIIALCSYFFAITGFLFFFPVPAITCLLAGTSLSIAAFRLLS
ncbi:MAG TPA: hypothetical protein VHO90_13990 [Bacteroidales bacterium]|nr:hypothetical protein [Bacteroidales bacterium]